MDKLGIFSAQREALRVFAQHYDAVIEEAKRRMQAFSRALAKLMGCDILDEDPWDAYFPLIELREEQAEQARAHRMQKYVALKILKFTYKRFKLRYWSMAT